MKFDLEYDLEQFMLEKNELFDEENRRYSGTILSNNFAEKMLKLIYDLKRELEEIEKNDSFDNCVKSVIKYLAENHHPHTKIIIENDKAELVEGIKSIVTDEYIVD